MQRAERFARFALVLILIGLPAATITYLLWPQSAGMRVIEIRASVPDAGGFEPASIQVRQGETVTLRFTSTDVTHGVAIGPGLDIDLGQIEPGHTKEITFTFERAGSFTFYCTTWCSDDHWRMRGVIDVQPQNAVIVDPVSDAMIEGLTAEGVDIDASFFSRGAAGQVTIDAITISVERGALLVGGVSVPENLNDAEWRQVHTPAEAYVELRAANSELAQDELVDVVAYLWLSEQQGLVTSDRYEQNCAACHGQYGTGDGPAADSLAKVPAAFADPSYMFHMRSDVLYAKIRRGGMGTDMPNFGTLFTPQESWALVDYLWKLAFDPSEAAERLDAIWSYLEAQ